jgi:hypothetical protein
MPPGHSPVLLASPSDLSPTFFLPRTFAKSRTAYNGSTMGVENEGGARALLRGNSESSGVGMTGAAKTDNADPATGQQSRWPVARVLVSDNITLFIIVY